MLTNEELKKKIVQIIADYFCPQKNEHKNLWGDDRMCYSKMNFAECERVTECTDALIAAGIGDVSSEKAMRELAEAFHREKCAEYDLLNYQMQKSEYRIAAAEHRADVAERALLNLCVDIQPYSLFDQTPLVTEASVKMQEYLQQAEKELTEERKDD